MADLGHQATACHDHRTTSGNREWALLLEACFAELQQTVESGGMAKTSPLREAPQRTIAEIAHACGFASLATFYRVFSASNGLTPAKFRDREAAIVSTAK